MGLTVKPLAAAVIAFGSTAALAEQTSTKDQLVIQFGETVVAAERNPAATEKRESTVLVERVRIEEQQPQSVAQALKYESNIAVSGGPRSSNQQPNIRGLEGRRVLQTIDGARQNFSFGHRGSYQLDPELLKQVEVTKGPASSLWGSGAIGGVVAQTTKGVSELLRNGSSAGGYLKQELGSNGDTRQTSGALYGLSGSFDYLLNASTAEHSDLELGNGEELSDSASENDALLAKAGWRPAKNQRLELSLRRDSRDEAVPSNPGSAVGSSSPLVERDISDQTLTANYQVQRLDGRHTTRATLYRNETQFDEFRPTLDQSDNTEIDTTGLAVTNASEGLGGQWVYGLDWYRDRVRSRRDGDNRPADLDAETSALGVFAQLDLSLGEGFTLTPGLRYDRYRAESEQLADSRRDDSAVSPSLRATYGAVDWLTLSAGYAEAFRAPGAEELYTQGTHFCYGDFSFAGRGVLCNTFIPNPELEAEEAANSELRADLQFADLWLNGDRLNASAALFRNRVDNFIEQLTINPDFMFQFPMNTTFRNVDEAELEGFEVSADYLAGDLALGVDYGQTEGRDLSDDSYLSSIPADKWVLDIGHYFLQRDLKLGLRATRASAQEQLPEGETREFDSYILADLYATWEPATGAARGLKLALAVDNLTDEHYRVAFQQLYMPGRNVKISASYSF